MNEDSPFNIYFKEKVRKEKNNKLKDTYYRLKHL